jgi:type I restriction enzyme M protein
MTKKPLSNLIDAARGELHSDAAPLLAAALLTWQKLTQTQRIPAELALTEELTESPRDAEKMLERVSESLQVEVFLAAAQKMKQLSQRSASQMLKMVMLQGQQGLLDAYELVDLATVLGSTRGESVFLPPEICDLLVRLGVAQGDSQAVYLPWDWGGQLFGRVLKKGLHANVEVLNADGKLYAELMQAYYEPSHVSRIRVSNPIASPAYIEKGVLMQFDCVIATPPFGAKVDFDTHANDPFNRFPERSNSMTVLAIRHAMAQVKGRAIVAVTNSVLFSAGGEKRLRKDLLEAGQIEAVIALPAGLLSGTNIPMSILVLNKANLHDRVRLINCDSDRFKTAESRTRFKLTNIDDIADLALGYAKSPDLEIVHRDKLFINDMNLLPSRYVMDDAMNRMNKLLAAYPLQKMEDLTTIIRPILGEKTEETIEAFEVGAQDIATNGYIESPQKIVSVAGDTNKNDTQFLRPLDIVMVIKGSVGKVSIAPPDTPAPGQGGWVIGQTMAVIRTRKGTDPRGLVVFLRSDLGQELLRRLVAGAAISFIQTRELRQLMVPVLTPEQVDQAVSVLEKQHQLNQEMHRLKMELDSIHVDAWRLASSSQTTTGG